MLNNQVYLPTLKRRNQILMIANNITTDNFNKNITHSLNEWVVFSKKYDSKQGNK